MNDFIEIKVFFHRYEAEQAKGLLEEQNIPAMISADDCGGFRPHLTLGMGNVRLLVPKSAVQKALEVLKVFEESASPDPLEQNVQASLSASEAQSQTTKPLETPVKIILLLIVIFPIATLLYFNFRTEIRKAYYPDGTIMREMTVKGFRANGPAKEYYENGSIKWEGSYKDHKLNGVVKQYDPEGRLLVASTYKDGHLDGPAKEYYGSDVLKWEGGYRNGLLDGAFKEWDGKNGEVLAEGHYKDGRLEGPYREYYPGGKLKMACVFSNSELDKICQRYFESGKLWDEIVRKDGKRLDENGRSFSGPEKVYYEDGTLESEGYYKDGVLDGEVKEYYENGVLKEIFYNRDGKLEGPRKIYSEDGALFQEIIYDADEPVEIKEYNQKGVLGLEPNK